MTTASPPKNLAPRTEPVRALFRSGFRSLGWAGAVMVSAVPGVLMPFLAALLIGGAAMAFLGSSDVAALISVGLAGLAGLGLAAPAVRLNAGWTRSQVERWGRVRMTVSYSNRPALEMDSRGYWWTGYSYHRSRGVAQLAQVVHWSLRDRTTRAEMVWLVVNPAAVLALILPVIGLLIGGVLFGLSAPADQRTYGSIDPGAGGASLLISFLLSVAIVLAALVLLPHALNVHADLARRVLDPQGRASNIQLTRRVAELTVTRAEAVGDQAAELRRIERDLHDGAQARLVAIGMTLGTIEHLLDSDPGAARQLLAEARQSSAKALQELRDLVRGIHPPVLAERGLGDAVRALAMDSAQETEVTVSLPARLEAPVEAAVYFSICELMANAAKHSGARHVWVDILYRADRLRVTVTDDGRGGVAPERGSGLRGIERRLGTFDGVLSLSGPQGGPTTITMELPCALSSPRTSTSFEKG
ncbi:sensor histidine kinase [Kitasatospora sp. NBC_00070]|uniref:sensor histidine kinase n=1 Tax=Kitasatospora sp. NBC_00070 TaxID=2975962 RepID=UPI003250EA86